MKHLWTVGLLFLLASGCAHQRGALAPKAGAGPGDPAPPVVAPAPLTGAPAAGSGAAIESEAGEAPASAEVADPIEPWNRAMFQFNDKVYFWVLKPVSRVYRAAVPRVARTGVENFFHNLGTPVRVVSDLLQLKVREAGVEVGKFMINSTWGVLGLGDWFARNPEAQTPDSDFGQALAQHGVGGGFYIVWPLLGPSTLRDSFGMVGDFALDPLTYVHPLELQLGARAGKSVNSTSFRIGDYESLKAAAIDPYLAARDAYLQNRAHRARGESRAPAPEE